MIRATKDKAPPQAAKDDTQPESAYRVMQALENGIPVPHLRIFIPTQWTDAGKGKPPAEQEALASDFENLARDLRQTLKDEGDQLESAFRRLLESAQGTFSPRGFFKKEGQTAIAHERAELANHEEEKRRKLDLRVGAIKRSFMIQSGISMCVAWILIITVTYGLSLVAATDDLSKSIRAMRVLLCGAMVGLTVANLIRLEDPAEANRIQALEALAPMWTKLFLYGLIILVLGLLLDQGGLEFSLGGFSTKAIHTTPAAAALFGALLGGAQKALPALYNRLSESVARALGEAVPHGTDRSGSGGRGPGQRGGKRR